VSVPVALGCALLGALLGPFLAGLTVTVPTDGEPVLTGGAWRGAAASPRRRLWMSLLAAAVLGVIGAGVGADAALPAYLWLGAVGAVLAVIDVDCHRLPDRLTLPSYPVGVLLLGVASLVHHDLPALGRAVLAGAIVVAVFFLLALISPASLGLGDVKLSGLLGLYLGWLGWGELVFGLVAGFLIGGLVGVLLLLGRRVGWRSDLAFGPSLLAGALLAVVAGQQLVDAYLSAGRPT
jgi:leader peptidase (prepilin peptidase) / N-methyltransferase